MSAIQISNTLDNLALGCSTSQADLTWAIQRNLLPAGTQPRYIRIDNINNSTGVFVSVTKETETITVPGASTTGNCFYVAPNNSVTVELITAIPLSSHPVIMLSVTRSVKVSTGVARTSAEPPLFDIVFVDAVISRVVNAPEV